MVLMTTSHMAGRTPMPLKSTGGQTELPVAQNALIGRQLPTISTMLTRL
jgi:hypothetical protein